MYLIIELFLIISFCAITQNCAVKYFKIFKYEAYLLCVVFIYCVTRDSISSDITYIDRSLSVVIQCFIFPVYFVSFFLKLDKNLKVPELFFKILSTVIIAAAVTAVVFLALPTLNDFYVSLIVKGEESSISSRFLRGFGFGENLTFSYPYVLGLFGAILIYKKINLTSIIWLIFIIVAITINARIAYIPLMFSLLFKLSRSPKFLIGTFSLVVLVAYSLDKLYLSDETNLMLIWAQSFFSDIFYFATFNYELISTGSSLRDLIENQIFFPNDIFSLFFGTGVNVFTENRFSISSDIGYITQIYYGGIVFLFLLSVIYFYCFFRIKKLFGSHRFYLLLCFISIIILNAKGSVFSSIPVTRLFSLIYVYLLISKHDFAFKSNLTNSSHKRYYKFA